MKIGSTVSNISVPKRSEIKLKNKNPKIYKSINFEKIDPSKDKLRVEFWDTNDDTLEEKKIGEAEFLLDSLVDGREEDIKLKLSENSFVYLKVLPINFPCSKSESLAHFSFLNNLEEQDPHFLNINNSIEQLSQLHLHPCELESPKYSLTYFKPEDIKRDFPYLSRGTFGVVYTGHVPGIYEKVVIKDIEIREQNSVFEWKREIETMGRVRSPYVVEIIGYSSSQNFLTIVMEYMPKGSLYDLLHIKKEKISLIQTLRMARHCALGLEHLHSKGIIHRDVKSMNILVGNDYSCKLTDFGNAKILDYENNLCINTANSGTPLWMAPEVKEGKDYSFSADIYSLGLVLYELFEKKLPHYNEELQVIELPKQFNSSNVVLNCINSNPKRRPTASTVVDILNKIIRNILFKVKEFLPKEDETILKIQSMKQNNSNESDELESKLLLLYTHLLQKDSNEVDALIERAFPDYNKSSQNVCY